MLSRAFVRLVDFLPLPSLRVQRIFALAVILSQAGISVTGAIVRVTSSGLGCPTWPQCFPGSFTPTAHAEVPALHQAVEFSNRMLTFAVTLCAALIVLAVVRARRRREVVVYAWLMPGGTVLQSKVLRPIFRHLSGCSTYTLSWVTCMGHALQTCPLSKSEYQIEEANDIYSTYSKPHTKAISRRLCRTCRVRIALRPCCIAISPRGTGQPNRGHMVPAAWRL